MSKEMKCPVCGEPLGILLCDVDDFVCKKCRMTGDEKLWQALIQSQRDLKIVKDFLQKIRMFVHKGDEQELAKIALEQITHDNKDTK